MASPRRKADTQDAPQTAEEAVAMLGVYLDALANIEQLKLDADRAIDEIRAARDGAVKPIEELAKQRFLKLRSWWSVEKHELTGGKRKSIELAGAEIGERTTPPRLVHQGIKPNDMIDRLLETYGGNYLRTKNSLDKPALIKALGENVDARLEEMGFDVAQREEFFIDRVEPEDSDPAEVAVGAVEIRKAAR